MSNENSFGLGSLFGPLFGSEASAQASEQYIAAIEKEFDGLAARVTDWIHSVREID